MEIKWIRIATAIFDNRKIKQIETLPRGDGIIVIWFKLLCLAGNINDNGMLYFTDKIPYSDQMLSTEFGRSLALIQLAMKTFREFGMVEIIDGIYRVKNWEKYQSVDKLSEIREYNRIAKKKSREKQQSQTNVNDMSMTCQPCQDTDIDIDIDIEKDKEIILKENKKEKITRHKYGQYSNVLLSDEEMEKLINEFPNDYSDRIERLSEYMASTGKSYKSHLATIRNWAKRDMETAKKTSDGWDYINSVARGGAL